MSRSRDHEADRELDEAYSPEYLRSVADDQARQERLAELKRRIELGAYHPDARSIAEGMLSRAAQARLARSGEDPLGEDDQDDG
jgi:anti-sigma28 factor (negative regulator of flagellin synthesis)